MTSAQEALKASDWNMRLGYPGCEIVALHWAIIALMYSLEAVASALIRDEI